MKKNIVLILLVAAAIGGLSFGAVQYQRAEDLRRLNDIMKQLNDKLVEDAATMRVLADQQRVLAERNAHEALMQMKLAEQAIAQSSKP